MQFNKDHWYDGIFYEKLIAPNQDGVFRIIKSLIKENSKVIDAGCGTGRLPFQLEDKCSRIDAVDLSQRNINIANKKLNNKPSQKIFFHHNDLSNFLNNCGTHYDYSVMTYVIHEINEDMRENIIKTLADFSDHIIIADYLYPVKRSFWSILNNTVEFVAGKEHYKGFKSFIAAKGLSGLAERTGLKIIKEIKNKPLTSHIVMLEK